MATTETSRPLMDLPAVAERLGVNHRHVRRLAVERRIDLLTATHPAPGLIIGGAAQALAPGMPGSEAILGSLRARWPG